MAKKSLKRNRVTLSMVRRISKPVNVSFTTRAGERVSFNATKRISKPVKVTFYKRRKKGEQYGQEKETSQACCGSR